jgi:hypothetical protein
MDVEKYAPFTSSPLDASRGRGRRFMLPRLRSVAATANPIRRTTSSAESTPTVVVFLTPQLSTASSTQQTTLSQVGGSSNGKNTK